MCVHHNKERGKCLWGGMGEEETDEYSEVLLWNSPSLRRPASALQQTLRTDFVFPMKLTQEE